LVRELKAHWRKQKKLKEAAGEAWTDLDLCFSQLGRQAARSARRLG
jgi:hypothetical protein